jgi:hypothetical protein
MQRIGIMGLCLVAAFAMSAIIAASASAAFTEEAPEYGQCLPKPLNGIGNWKDAGCRVPKGPSLTEHKYEWYPGFGENGAHDPPRLITKPKFTSKLKPGTLAIFEVDHVETVTCTGETATGEITGPKTVGGLVATFSGCTEVAGNRCQSKHQPAGRVVMNTLHGELGIIKDFPIEPTKTKIGLDLFMDGTEFECVGVSVAVRGSVIHEVAANAMKLTSPEQFVGAGGEQKPETFESLAITGGHGPAFLSLAAPENVLEASIAGAKFEESSLSLTTSQRNEMKIEVSAIN